MKSSSLKIIFMGTPDFAVPSLNALHKSKYEVLAVVTQPDRAKGRGRKILPTPVKQAALSLNYPIIQVESVKTDDFCDKIKSFEPDVLVVVAFGQILDKQLLNIPKLGAVNIHPSLLPLYRGPAPMQWSIINGDTQTGVTTMLLDENLDTGDILLKIPEDTTGSLHDRLAESGAELLLKTLDGIESNSIKPISQDHSKATYAPLLTKKHALIDWNNDAKHIHCLVRGLNPVPGAYTFWENKRLKIFKTDIKRNIQDISCVSGTVIAGNPNELLVATKNGVLSISELQGEAGKRLSVADFLRGCTIPAGTVFHNGSI